jgi:uncharacterized membrane protein
MIPGLDILLGGLTGLIGNAFTTWFKYKNAKMEYEHDEKMVELKTKALIQQAEMKIQITKAQIEGAIEIADSESYKKSQEVGSQKLFHEKWIDMIMEGGERKYTGWFFRLMGTIIALFFALTDWLNGMMRPAMTLYLIGTSTYITYLAWQIMQKFGVSLSANQAVAIFQQVTSTMIYLAVSAVTWWFGDRTMSKYLQQRGAQNNRQGMRPGTNPEIKPGTTPNVKPGTTPGGGGDVEL